MRHAEAVTRACQALLVTSLAPLSPSRLVAVAERTARGEGSTPAAQDETNASGEATGNEPTREEAIARVVAIASSSSAPPWPLLDALARATADSHTTLESRGASDAFRAVATARPAPVLGLALRRGAGEGVVVIEVVPTSDAEAAGLRPGDEILAIDGRPSTRGMADALELMGRAEGTTSRLRVRREGQSLVLDLPTTVGILVPGEHRVLDVSPRVGRAVGYVRLRFITSSTDPDAIDSPRIVAAAMHDFTARGLQGAVLDLRANPGGYDVGRTTSLLTSAEHVTCIRWPSATRPVDAHDGHDDHLEPRSAPRAPALPLVVLVDAQTNSAAEMLALCLQENGDAIVVGEPTAGGLSIPTRLSLGEGWTLEVPGALAIGPRTRRLPRSMRVHPDLRVPSPGADELRRGIDPPLAAALAHLA